MYNPWKHVLVHQHKVYWCTEDDMSHDNAFSVTVPHLSNLSITKKKILWDKLLSSTCRQTTAIRQPISTWAKLGLCYCIGCKIKAGSKSFLKPNHIKDQCFSHECGEGGCQTQKMKHARENEHRL